MRASGVLQLPLLLWTCYEQELTDRGLLNQAQINRGGAIHGGQDQQSTIDHFCHRYGNSASRVTYFVLDPDNRFTEDQQRLLQSFATGSVAILDLACGAGAASFGLLSTLAEMRTNAALPTLPLNIHISAADISVHALDIYRSLIVRASEQLSAAGIHLTIEMTSWDMSSVEATNELCDRWFNACQVHQANELVVVMANISGDKEVWQSGSRSISHIAERVSNKQSSILWIEPGSDRAKNLLKRAVEVDPIGGTTGAGFLVGSSAVAFS